MERRPCDASVREQGRDGPWAGGEGLSDHGDAGQTELDSDLEVTRRNRRQQDEKTHSYITE